MDLQKLQNTWNQYSSRNTNKELDEDAFKDMLKIRTKSVLERIGRNIKVGIFILFALVLFFVLDDTVISPIILQSIPEGIEIPGWLVILDILTNLIIITIFSFFVVHYYKAKKRCDISCDLKNTLKQIIRILILYQRLFLIAVIFLMLATAVDFIAGMHSGILFSASQKGIVLNDIESSKIVLIIFVGIVIILLLTGGIFFLFRWIFKRLYGNYLQKLKLTLKELDEIE